MKYLPLDNEDVCFLGDKDLVKPYESHGSYGKLGEMLNA